MSHSKPVNLENVDYYHSLALNIAYYRRVLGYTQAVLAEKADISLSFLSLIESRNVAKPFSLEVLFNLAHELNVPPYQLLQPLTDNTHSSSN